MASDQSFKLTYATMFNPPEELHTRYEAALAKVRSELGREHGMMINGKDVFADEKFENRSPADTDVVLGIFQKGNAEHAKLPSPPRARPSRDGRTPPGRSGWPCCAKPQNHGPAHL